MKKTCLILYVPVLHQGYINLFEKYRGKVDTLFILSKLAIQDLSPFREIRMLDPNILVFAIKKLGDEGGLIRECEVVWDPKFLRKELKKDPPRIITTNDVIGRKFAEKYLKGFDVSFETAFLRWDESNVNSSVTVNCDRVSKNPFNRQMIEMARVESDKSSDWWRHIGALLVKDKKILFEAHNMHLPTEHTQYIEGDPRDFVAAGTNPEICSAIHAEPLLIAQAAKQGININGCDIYLSTFPCPPCAKILACAGIKKVFFASGNAYLDAESVLKAKGVEIILVQM